MHYFIINPNSGNQLVSKMWSNIEKILESNTIPYEFSKTEHRHHAIEITTQAIASGHRNIVCVGGDGTMNEIVNAIMTQSVAAAEEIKLGMIPTGTGNDWSRSHNIPKNFEAALNLILNGKFIQQDVGKLTFLDGKERYFANVAGIGFDAVVANNVNADKENGKTGKILFVKNLLKCLLKAKTDYCSIKIDNADCSMNVFTMAVGIGRYNGGGMMQLPNAEINDGLFDVTIISDISKFDVLRYAPLLFNGKFIKHPAVHCYQGKSLMIKSDLAIPIEVDGEEAGELPVRIEIVPSALSVFSNIHN